MNWLAHILLSRKNVEYQLGNFLADPLKGRPWKGASQSIKTGMLMHISIDGFTDAHWVFSKSKSRLGKKGYLKAVVVDLLYDHFLACAWDSYANDTLDEFLATFHAESFVMCESYPDRPRHIVSRLVESEMLVEYSSFSGFVRSLQRIDARLSQRLRNKESALDYIPIVENEYESLKSDFERFFPELIAFFKSHKLGSSSDNFFL